MTELRIKRTKEGFLVPVKLQPRASRAGFCGSYGEWLKVKVCSPPLEGRANKECIEVLAGLFDIPKGYLKVFAGEKTREKLISIPSEAAPKLKKAFEDLGITAEFD